MATPVRPIRIDDELWDLVLEMAEHYNATASDVVRDALTYYLDPDARTDPEPTPTD